MERTETTAKIEANYDTKDLELEVKSQTCTIIENDSVEENYFKTLSAKIVESILTDLLTKIPIKDEFSGIMKEKPSEDIEEEKQELHVETTTAIVGIGEMKDLIPEEESKQELILVNDEEIKVIEKDDQKTEIPEIADVDGIKDLMQEGEIATTPSVAVASENSSDVPSL